MWKQMWNQKFDQKAQDFIIAPDPKSCLLIPLSFCFTFSLIPLDSCQSVRLQIPLKGILGDGRQRSFHFPPYNSCEPVINGRFCTGVQFNDTL